MVCGGMLSGTLPPIAGCPLTHQHPFFTQHGGLYIQGEKRKSDGSIEGTYSGQTFKSGITDGTEQVTSRVSNSWSASATLLLTLTLQERKMTMSAVHKTETDISIPF